MFKFFLPLSHKILCILLLSTVAFILPLIKIGVDYQENLSTVYNELRGNVKLDHLKNLVYGVSSHRSLTNQARKEKEPLSNDIRQANQIIEQSLNQLLFSEAPLSAYQKNTRQLIRQWQEIKQLTEQAPLEETIPLYNQLNEQIHEEFATLGRSHQLLRDHLDPYQLIYSSFVHLLRLQSLLFQNSYRLIELMQLQGIDNEQFKYIFTDLQFIHYHLKEMAQLLKEAHANSEKKGNKLNFQLNEVFQSYAKLIDQLNLLLKNQISLAFNAETSSSLLALANQAINKGNQLGEQMSDEIELILLKRKNQLQIRFWSIFSISLLAFLSALFLGLYTYLKSIEQITSIKEFTAQMVQGKVANALRQSNSYEVSKLQNDLNLIAKSLDHKNFKLHRLIEAIQKLSEGDLSIRLKPVAYLNDDNMVHAFNKMAENREKAAFDLQKAKIKDENCTKSLANFSKEQKAIFKQQESAIKEVTFSTTEIYFNAKELSSILDKLNKEAEQIFNLVKEENFSNGKGELKSQMMEAFSTFEAQLTLLNEQATPINTFIATISKVSDQTTLLSLNTSIEAEKAGEHGKTFAVIAREIRRLADQTTLATSDVEKIVKEIKSTLASSLFSLENLIKEGNERFNQAQLFNQQIISISRYFESFIAQIKNINQKLQMQSLKAEQMNEEIDQLDDILKKTASFLQNFDSVYKKL